jgi:hypothetical protein
MADNFEPAGGTALVYSWLGALAKPDPGPLFWAALDQPLRLCLVQGWMMNRGFGISSDRDLVAEQLSHAQSTHTLAGKLLADVAQHMREVYADLGDAPALVDVTDLVGVDMELVVVTSEEFAGDYPAGAQIPVHCFVTRLIDGGWRIAANARRLPVPGWPPTEVPIAGLSIS